MRYEWTSNDSTIRGDLDARQVADMAAAGMALAVVREYRCTRGAERHHGEHTDAEISALTSDGWTCEVGDAWPMELPAPPTLAALQSAALSRVRAATAAHILAVYPDWYQRNCALGVYSEALAQKCADDIADCVEASNAAESAIAAATGAAGVAAAEAALALPKIGGAA